ncbi:46 kDa FK506-binding nuclear protein-like [Prunus avium]|uniref:46 kDa FK506-binding nuclear protein-like n=1 Tax=Prunus avium TaxID=42229 RepID=A0A6P5TYQ8_PRUAV|nr:46 kDa FK506-binding nuclear protein-like [Prunus avium]
MRIVEDGVCSIGLKVQASEIKIPPWTVQVVGWGDADDCEVLVIPRGKSNTCLPLSKDVKYVSASTAAELLDMISGLNSLLFTKCMAARSIIRDLAKKRCIKHNNDRRAGKEIDDGEDGNEIDGEDGEFDDNTDDGFENSSEEGENSTKNDNEEEEEEEEENEDEDEENDKVVEEEEVDEDGEDDEEDSLVVYKPQASCGKPKSKSSPIKNKGTEAVLKTKDKRGEVHTKEKAVVLKAKGNALPEKLKASLPKPEPISKRLRKKT